MKRIIILGALALLMQSCVVSTTKTDGETPQFQSVRYLNDAVLEQTLWSITLADFFDNYQKIKEDRDAAIALGKEYFGDRFMPEWLVYENYESGTMGKIHLTDVPGLYKIVNLPRMGSGMIELYVEVSEGRKYHVTTKMPRTKETGPMWMGFKSEIECTATVTPEGIGIIENLDIEYIEENNKKITEARITSTSDPAKFRIFNENVWNFTPFAGTLDYEIGGDVINDEFSVKYSESKFDIL